MRRDLQQPPQTSTCRLNLGAARLRQDPVSRLWRSLQAIGRDAFQRSRGMEKSITERRTSAAKRTGISELQKMLDIA